MMLSASVVVIYAIRLLVASLLCWVLAIYRRAARRTLRSITYIVGASIHSLRVGAALLFYGPPAAAPVRPEHDMHGSSGWRST